jgi:integrase
VIRIRWSDYDGSRINLVQQKTGSPLAIPVHRILKRRLYEAERHGDYILLTRTGLPYMERTFSRDFMKARAKAELTGLSFHGLRHTAASKLAEVGCSAPEIQAITGHKSLKLVQHYISQASQEDQAEAAIIKLSNYRGRSA